MGIIAKIPNGGYFLIISFISNAERARFELADRVNGLLFSRQVPSASQPSLRARNKFFNELTLSITFLGLFFKVII